MAGVVPEADDQVQRQPLGQGGLDQDGAQHEGHDVEPDHVETEHAQHVLLVPAVGKDQGDHQDQRGKIGGYRLADPPDQGQGEAGQDGLPGGSQPGRERQVKDQQEDSQPGGKAEVLHPPLGAARLPFRDVGQLVLFKVEDVIEGGMGSGKAAVAVRVVRQLPVPGFSAYHFVKGCLIRLELK